MDKQVKLYVLVDPLTLKVRYIGRTTCTLAKRLSEHIGKAKRSSRKTHKENWLLALLAKNCKPYVRCLTMVQGWQKSHDVERNLIAKHAAKHNLLNHDDRGEGECNHIVTEDQKIRIAATLSKKFQSGELLNPASKPTYVYNLEGAFLAEFPSGKHAAKALSVYYSSVRKCLTGIFKQVKGYQITQTKLTCLPNITLQCKRNYDTSKTIILPS